MARISRREILQALLSAVWLPVTQPILSWRAQGASLLVEQLQRRPDQVQEAARKTFYRADATILLLSLPIYKRRGVGGGRVELEQCRDSDRDSLTIRFSAGSYPKQARGLNRLGYIEEVAVSRANRVEELAYFGFLTSSPEKDVAEARRALEESHEGAVTYSAAEGHIHGGTETSRKSSLSLASACTWTETEPLLDQIRTAFLEDTGAEIFTRKRTGLPATFLFSLLSAAWGQDAKFDATYSYLAKDYRMSVEKKPDVDTGRRFAQEGLTNFPESVVRLKGTIQELGKDKLVKFRLWSEDTGRPELPIRFEYKARSFLRVSFERDPSQAPSDGSM